VKLAIMPVRAVPENASAEFYPDLLMAADACSVLNTGHTPFEPAAAPRNARSTWAVVAVEIAKRH
jgi:hypothetical protein